MDDSVGGKTFDGVARRLEIAEILLRRILDVGNGGVINSHGFQAEGVTGQVYDFLGIEPPQSDGGAEHGV